MSPVHGVVQFVIIPAPMDIGLFEISLGVKGVTYQVDWKGSWTVDSAPENDWLNLVDWLAKNACEATLYPDGMRYGVVTRAEFRKVKP